MKKYFAEALGTAVLVLIGCGAVVIGGYGAGLPQNAINTLPIALAFGLAVTGMAYALGPISGCHLNPSVTIAAWAAGRLPTSDVPGYIASQIVGAFIGAGFLALILSGKAGGYDIQAQGLAQTGWGAGYLGQYSLLSALIVEFVATFIFMVVILGATSKAGTTPVAGLVIGLTLAVLILTFINVTGVSLNPARSLAPAVYVGGTALAQVWLFLIVPPLAALLAGFLFKNRVLEAE
jgi:aquaporin Z